MSAKSVFENLSSFDFSSSAISNLSTAALFEDLRGGWKDEDQTDSGSLAMLDFPDSLVDGHAAGMRFQDLTDLGNSSALAAIGRFLGEERGASSTPATLGNSSVWSDTPALELIEHHDSCGCSGCCGFREEPTEAEAAAAGEAITGESSGAAGMLGDMADFLLTGYWNTGYGDGTRSHNVTNSGVDANNGVLHYNLSGYSGDADGLTANRAELVRESFKLFESTLGVEFVETTSTNTNLVDFFFKDNDSGAYAGSSYYNNGAWGSTLHYSTINIAQSWSGGTSTYDDYTLQTILHEIGHALGLGHQGPYNGNATFGVDNTFDNDNWQSSMMSYFSQTQNSTVNASYEFLQTPMAVDWLALDEIYGRQGYGVSNAYTEDTTWGFNTTVTSDVSDIWASWSSWANRTASTIVDGGGIDTLDLSGYSNNSLINLAPSDPGSTQPSTSNIGGRIGNLTIAAGTVIENVVGGAGNETFYGNAADNVMIGNGGDDVFHDSEGSDRFEGGAGVDDVIFSGSFADFTYSVVGDFLQVTDTVVDWVQDTVEWLVFAGDDRHSWQSIADLSVDNTAPVANDDVGSVDEGNSVVISLLENDTDVDGDALSIVSIGAAANGTVTDNGDGTVTYTPDADFYGEDSFSYTVTDGNGGTDTAAVTIDVLEAIAPPVEADILLALDTLETGSFGNKFNGQTDADGAVTASFTGTGADLRLTFQGFDVDVADEIELFLNGGSIGFLDAGVNEGFASYSVGIAAADQVSGQNIITFDQARNDTWKWGVTDLLLSEASTPPPPPPGADILLALDTLETGSFGNKFNGQTDADGAVTASFTGTDTDLRLTFQGYDVDFADEIELFLNGGSIGFLDAGVNEGFASYSVDIAAADQVGGQNIITFDQAQNNTWKWGVTDLLLSEASTPPPPTPPVVADVALALDTLETGSFGNKFDGQTDADGAVTASFTDTGTDLRLTFQGFDVDVADEIELFLNGNSIGFLDAGVNEGFASYSVDIAAADQVSGQNIITFDQARNDTWKWGVTDLLLSESSASNPVSQQFVFQDNLGDGALDVSSWNYPNSASEFDGSMRLETTVTDQRIKAAIEFDHDLSSTSLSYDASFEF